MLLPAPVILATVFAYGGMEAADIADAGMPQAEQAQMQEVAVKHVSWMLDTEPGVSLKIEQFGNPQDPVILLISGAGAPAAYWPDFFCEELAQSGYRVVRFDHRDTGMSSHFDEPYDIAVLKRDILAIIADLDADEVHLAGHSMGGYLVNLILSADRPGQVKSGAVMAAGPTVDPARYAEFGMSSVTEETWAALVGNEPQGDFERDLRGWMDSWEFLNGDIALDRELAEAYTKALYVGDPRNAQVAVNHIHAVTTIPGDLPERLAEIDRPFMVIHGTQDMLVPPDNGRVLARLVPGARFVALEGAGHMYFSRSVWAQIRSALVEHTR